VRWLFFKGIRNPKITVQSPILVPCSSVFLLTAEVEDGSFYKWEQTSGTPILIDSPNTQSTEVFRGATPGPFIFRLTVNNLSSALIEVFTTPTSNLSCSFSSTSFEHLPNPIQGYIQPPPRSIQEGWQANSSEGLFTLQVIPPVFNLAHLIGYEVRRFTESGLEYFGFFEPPYIDFAPGFKYEITATYSIFGRPYTSVDIHDVGLNNKYALADDHFSVSLSGSSLDLEFNKVSLEFLLLFEQSPLSCSLSGTNIDEEYVKVTLEAEPINALSGLSTSLDGSSIQESFTKVDLSGGMIG